LLAGRFWDWATLVTWKQQAITDQGVLTTVSGRETFQDRWFGEG
jgi:hypothetical protein